MQFRSILVAVGMCAGLGAAQVTQQVTQQQSPPATITLKDALERAKTNSPEYRAAVTDAGLRHEDKVIARSTLLPNVRYGTQYIYTEAAPRGQETLFNSPIGGGQPRFIANNGVHEYMAQGNAHQDLSAAAFADYNRTVALEVVSKAKAEVAARGLVLTVVDRFYSFAAAQRKLANAQRAVDESQRFLSISQKLERGGEAAHSDVIKAQIQANDRNRDLQEAQLALTRTRLELAVLLFRDFNQNFTIADDLSAPEPLATREEIAGLAQRANPSLAAAIHAYRAAQFEVTSSKADYLPSLSFDYFYGIDAPQFALKTNGLRNLGYSATATLNLPVWNWFATNARVKQATLSRDQAKVELSAAQKQLLADLQLRYDEAQTASQELDKLRESAQLAADGLRLTTMRYQGGESTVLEVVDAQNTLTLARNALNDGELRYKVALAVLQTLTGTLNP
jgi:outer membrane protein TolC